MTSPQHRVVVKNKAGTQIGQFSQVFNLKFSEPLNNYGTATFDIPVDSDDATKLIALRIYEIDIYQDSHVVWSGEQANAEVTLKANSEMFMTITCYTYIEMLNARVTLPYVRYEATDQADILKALVDESQTRTNGNFGFTFAPITPTKDRDREYKLDNIMECFINMSNVISGIDFWVSKDKVIYFSSKRGLDKSNQYVFELGVNVSEMPISDNFSTPANKAYAVGSTDGLSQSIESYADSATGATYKLREQVVSAIDVSETDTLIDKAHKLVDRNKRQVRTIRIVQLPNTLPYLYQLGLGDRIKVRAKKGRYNIDTKYRVLGYECSIGSVGEENITWQVIEEQ